MSAEKAPQPRVGIPYRTRKEELSNKREAYDKYVTAVQAAGGEPVEISACAIQTGATSDRRRAGRHRSAGQPRGRRACALPCRGHPKLAEADSHREETDFPLLDHAIAEHKPILAICYGVQSLNVHQGGSLIQDIPSELHTKIQHSWLGHEGPEPHHAVALEAVGGWHSLRAPQKPR